MSNDYYEGTTQGATPVTEPYYIVTVASDGTVLAAAENAGNGILTDPGGGTAGDPCVVMKRGRTKVYSSVALTVDDFVTGAAAGATAGQAKVAASTHIKVASVLSACAAGQLADVSMSGDFDQHSAAP